jgi:NADPH-dependent curcumin reductase CurA
MTEAKNRQIILVSRPHGEPKPENFKLAEAPIPAISPGQVLLKSSFLSLDPYMRGRMSTRGSAKVSSNIKKTSSRALRTHLRPLLGF